MIALAIALALVSWLVTRGDDDAAAEEAVTERIVPAAELRDVAASLEQVVYWAGPPEGAELQLVEFEAGLQVRYLREGASAVEAPTIGTYPAPGAAAELRDLAAQPGAVRRRGAGGRLVVTSSEQPTSAYFAAGDSALVEIYDPSPARAMSLARSPRVRPVGER